MVGVLPHTIYIVDTRQGEIDVYESEDFIVTSNYSPECGYMPTAGLSDIGYTIGRRNGKMIFSSNTLHKEYTIIYVSIFHLYLIILDGDNYENIEMVCLCICDCVYCGMLKRRPDS